MNFEAFKQKVKAVKTDEYERHRFVTRAQVAVVGGFWVIFTVALLAYGHAKEMRERAAFRPPVVPEVLPEEPGKASMPTVHLPVGPKW